MIAGVSSRDLEWAQFAKINSGWQFEHFIAVCTIFAIQCIPFEILYTVQIQAGSGGFGNVFSQFDVTNNHTF